jgi:predicted metal-binding transcription factor (methanogenesis marker protein 9)
VGFASRGREGRGEGVSEETERLKKEVGKGKGAGSAESAGFGEYVACCFPEMEKCARRRREFFAP